MTTTPKPRVLVIGQVPPPMSGQHVMVQRLLDALRAEGTWEVRHVAPRFSESIGSMRHVSVGKVVTLLATMVALVRERRHGRADVAVYPVGGVAPQSSLRDAAILPFVRLAARRTVLHMHGAGHAAHWHPMRWWMRLARAAYRRADRAVVMTRFNREDPTFLGVPETSVVPHPIPDRAGRRRTVDGADRRALHLLYVGHLGPQRGTPALLGALGDAASRTDVALHLHLVGDCLEPYAVESLRADIASVPEPATVHWDPELRGDATWEAFAGADCFVFPSVFPCESFGLVLAEALMFGLPIVVTEWRGNLDVVTDACDRVVVQPGASADDLRRSLAAGLVEAASRWSPGDARSERNRRQYERRFADDLRWGMLDVVAELSGSRRDVVDAPR